MQTQADFAAQQAKNQAFFSGLFGEIYGDLFRGQAAAAKAPTPKRRKAVRRRARRVALLDFIVGRGGEVVDVRMVGRPARRVRR